MRFCKVRSEVKKGCGTNLQRRQLICAKGTLSVWSHDSLPEKQDEAALVNSWRSRR